MSGTSCIGVRFRRARADFPCLRWTPCPHPSTSVGRCRSSRGGPAGGLRLPAAGACPFPARAGHAAVRL
eukprot:7210801-Pyramimonas_sp.AAC.1